MSVWNRLGDILGSFTERTGIAGSVAGLFDVERWLPGGRDAAFTLALIALSAKMAKADGVVSQSEIDAFYQTVDVPEQMRDQVDRLFHLSQRDVAGFDIYAQQVSRLFKDSPETLEHVLDGLIYIAKADQVIHEDELAYLRQVAVIFGFSDTDFERLLSRHVDLGDADPYHILGVDRNISDENLRRHYRQLVAEHHPDRLIAKGVPEEAVKVTTDKLAAINGAYDRVCAERDI